MGTFIVGETKIRPGEYHRIENASGIQTAGAKNGIIAGVIHANWGPLNEAITMSPSTNVKKIFGSGNTQSMIDVMFEAGNVKGYFVRVGSGGTAGTITLKDSAVESVNVVTINAKYVGSRPFAVTIRDSLTNTDKRECVIYDGTAEFEKVSFDKGAADGEASALVAAFAKSENFTASKVSDGNGTMATVTQSAFTVGTDPTVNVDAYASALEALEAYEFNVLCVDTEDTAVHALVESFINRTYTAGSYPMAVLSESSQVALATRQGHAKAFNNSKIVYVLNGGKDADGNVMEGYINAARIGGMIAYCPSNKSVTHSVISKYADLSESLTNTQIENALLSGCLVLSKNAEGNVWIEQGINTLVNPSDNEDDGWKKIRRVKTRYELMQRIGDTVAKLVGKIDNDPDGRSAVIAAGQSVINDMIANKKLLPGSIMMEDEGNPAKGDSAWFVISVDDIDSIEKFYLTYRFRFTAEN